MFIGYMEKLPIQRYREYDIKLNYGYKIVYIYVCVYVSYVYNSPADSVRQ